MIVMRQFFQPPPKVSPKAGPKLDALAKPSVSPILAKCSEIHHVLLKHMDRTLYEHLIKHDVQPSLYLLRWVRLMLAGEYHVEDVVRIWDVVFAKAPAKLDESSFDFLGFLCAAMCLFVRAQCQLPTPFITPPSSLYLFFCFFITCNKSEYFAFFLSYSFFI